MMDYDGYNHKILTNGENLVLTPRFSQMEKVLFYNIKIIKHVYLMNLTSKKII